MNKYHITKKNYISRFFISFFSSLIVFALYFSIFFATEEDTEGLREQPFIIELGLFVIPLIVFIFLAIYSWFLMRKYVFYDDSKNLVIVFNLSISSLFIIGLSRKYFLLFKYFSKDLYKNSR